MICDSHIHVGDFYGGLYFTPEDVATWVNKNNIDKFLFFQTSRSENYGSAYKQFFNDAKSLQNLVGNKAIPALWLTLEAFKSANLYIKDEIVALKFHPNVEKNLKDSDYEYVFKVAENFDLPIIVHTGYDEYCASLRIAKIYVKSKVKTPLILAHGRPFEDCLGILKENSNIYADTAYMPPEEAQKFVEMELGDKLLFGSDFPLDRYFYPEENELLRYQDFMKKMQNILPPTALFQNFQKLFCRK